MRYQGTTVKQKIKDGTIRAKDRKTNFITKKAGEFEIKPPDFLDEKGRAWFIQQGEILRRHGILQESDLTVLGIASEAYSDYLSTLEAIRDMRERESLEEVENIVEHLKALASLERLKMQKAKSFLDLAKSLGSTALDRGKVRKEEKADNDEFAEFME